MSARRCLVFPLLAVLVALQARADSGGIPIWRPTAITSPGRYIVTRDITGDPSGHVITIDSVDVVLDLNGHTITTLGTNTGISVPANPSAGRGSIEIRNGRIRGGVRSVSLHSGAGVRLRLEELDISGGPYVGIEISGTTFAEIVRCRFRDAETAVYVPSGPGAVSITENEVMASTFGFNLQGIGGGVVRDNVVTSAGFGLYVANDSAPGMRIEGNVFRSTAANSVGISLSSGHNLVIDNVITGGKNGIRVISSGNRISGNVIGDTGVAGIEFLSSDNTFERNVVESGQQNGVLITLGAHNLIDGNSIQGHLGWGIVDYGAGGAYRGNMLRNNVSGTVFGPSTDEGGNILP